LQANNWRNSRNVIPANLDLFQTLDAAITTEERRQGVKIGFWHISRKYNNLADGLAKAAAQHGDPA
jgi:ribonuclease HI